MTSNTNYTYQNCKIHYFNATKTKFYEKDHFKLDDNEIELKESIENNFYDYQIIWI